MGWDLFSVGFRAAALIVRCLGSEANLNLGPSGRSCLDGFSCRIRQESARTFATNRVRCAFYRLIQPGDWRTVIAGTTIQPKPMYQRFQRFIFALAVAIRATAAAMAAITLDASYDSASLKSYSVAGNTVNLVGRDNYYGALASYPAGSWRWLNFRASGVQNLTPSFSIRGDLFAGDHTDGPHELSEHEMVYSYDGELVVL